MPKYDNSYKRRKLKFEKELRDSGCTTKQELNKLKIRRFIRKNNQARRIRRGRRDRLLWDKARRNTAKMNAIRQAQRERYEVVNTNLRRPEVKIFWETLTKKESSWENVSFEPRYPLSWNIVPEIKAYGFKFPYKLKLIEIPERALPEYGKLDKNDPRNQLRIANGQFIHA
jgi:hypothetical protein